MGILTEDMKRLIREQRMAYVATVNADGTPNLAPKATTAVYDDDHLAYLDIASPNTRRNLGARPAVEINVIDLLARRGYRFTGTGRFVDQGPEHDAAMAFFRARMPIPYRVHGVVLIRIDRVAPLMSPAYGLGRTEDELVDEFSRHYDAVRTARHHRDA